MRQYIVREVTTGSLFNVSAENPREAIKKALPKTKLEIELGTAEKHNFEVCLSDGQFAKGKINYYIGHLKYTEKELTNKKIQVVVQKAVKERNLSSTYYYKLGRDDKGRVWAVVLGWMDGFENEAESPFMMDKEYRLCGKVAYIEGNSMMGEYDMDWIMPYDKRTGDVDDTELSLTSFGELENDIDWWLNQYKRFKKKYNIVDYK